MRQNMTHPNISPATAPLPTMLQIGALRAGLALAIIASLLAVAIRAHG